jgi:TolB protein
MRRLIAGLSLGLLLALFVLGCGGGGSSQPPDLIFVRSLKTYYALYGMQADGKDQERLPEEGGQPSTPELFYQIDPAWSPDGRLVAFASNRMGALEIYAMRLDGTGTRRLTSGDEDSNPAWSPDGKRIVFARGTRSNLALMNADGTDVHRLTDDDAEEFAPAWSPDGSWIAYSRRTPGTSAREIWLVRPDGSGRRQLTRLEALSSSPTWSPDGKRIAFSSDTGGGRTGIFAVGIDGKGFHRVTFSLQDDDIEPAWSPDGKTIAFSRGGAIAVVTGGEVSELTARSNNDSNPAWNPQYRGPE